MSAPTLHIRRVKTGDHGTFGRLALQFAGSCLTLTTLELPWRSNTRSISCIPVGRYDCEYEYSAKFGRKLWELKDVPARSEIKFHAGNHAGDVKRGLLSDSAGCILLGLYESTYKGQSAIVRSSDALAAFHSFLKGAKEATVEIAEDYD